MDQEKIGNFIKEIRKKNNLTQKQLADKYHVTYQAVSKWENGKNMPDMVLIKKMSEDFGISLEEMLDGEIKKNKYDNTNKNKLLLGIVIVLIIGLVLVIWKSDSGDFKFKTLTSQCENFNISGNIAYNDKKTSIYITNIQYCGESNSEEYEMIECVLYEAHDDIAKKIGGYRYDKDDNITLDEFLKLVTLSVDDYQKTCREYSENSLYLSINAQDKIGKITTYKIPLSLEQSCIN